MSVNEIDEINKVLGGISNRAKKLKPAQQEIGRMLVKETRERFREQRDPDGRTWKPLAAATLAARRRRGNPRTLALLDTLALFKSIDYSIQGKDVSVSSDKPYAAVHHFGYPPGNIAKRTAIGQGPETNKKILKILEDHLAKKKRRGISALFKRIYRVVVRLF